MLETENSRIQFFFVCYSDKNFRKVITRQFSFFEQRVSHLSNYYHNLHCSMFTLQVSKSFTEHVSLSIRSLNQKRITLQA